MSNLTDFGNDAKIIILNKKQSIQERVIMHLLHSAFLILLIYVSRDSAWWTLVTGITFLLFLFYRMMEIMDKNGNTFTDKEKAKAHIDGLDLE